MNKLLSSILSLSPGERGNAERVTGKWLRECISYAQEGVNRVMGIYSPRYPSLFLSPVDSGGRK